jgi:hypothetical protein
MLDQLMNIIKEHGQKAVVENNEVPNEHNDAVMQEAGSSIFGGLQQMISNGKMEDLTGLLQGNNNNAANGLAENFAGSIAQKFGINAESAKNIAGGLIPQVLGSLVSKAKDPNDKSIDLQGILGSLTSGKGGGVQNILNSVGGQFGLDKDKDGDVDFGDIAKMFGK